MNRNAVQQASVSCIFQGKAQAVEEICSNMLLIVTAVVLSSPQFVGCKPLHRSFFLKKKRLSHHSHQLENVQEHVCLQKQLIANSGVSMNYF